MPSIKVRQLKPRKVDSDRANDLYYIKQRLVLSIIIIVIITSHMITNFHYQHYYNRYIKPDDVSMDGAVDKKVSASHKPILLDYSSYEDSSIINDTNDDNDDNSRYTLDGFRLLEASTMSLPEDVKHITITDKRLKYVVEEDLAFFVNLIYLDVSGPY